MTCCKARVWVGKPKTIDNSKEKEEKGLYKFLVLSMSLDNGFYRKIVVKI